jgi:hypothetical protein
MNLFNITKELSEIISQLEDGEVTDELLEQLTITEENLKEKLQEYVSVIHKYEDEEESCKKEIARITAIKKSKENTYSRLRRLVLDAVMKFGTMNKSGNYVIEAPLYKLFSRNSTSIEYDKDLIDKICRGFINIIANFISETDIEDVLDIEYLCNILIKEFEAELAFDVQKDSNDDDSSATGELEKSEINITPDDLELIEATITIKMPIKRIADIDNNMLVSWIGSHPHLVSVEGNINKTQAKAEMQKFGLRPNLIKEVIKTSLTIK